MVKEINYRVKGTEMFWNDPEGGGGDPPSPRRSPLR